MTTTETLIPLTIWDDPAEVPADVRDLMECILASDDPQWGLQGAKTIALYGTPPDPDSPNFQDTLDCMQACAQIVNETICYSCEERTLDPSMRGRDAAGLDLCVPCLDAAELENEHLDGHHAEDHHYPECKMCRDGVV